MHRIGLLVLGMLLLSGESAQGRDIDLSPRGPWSLVYADERCTLTRALGAEDAPTFVQLVQTSPSDSFRLQVISRLFSRVENNQEIRLRFGKTDPFVRQNTMVGTIKDLPMLFLYGRLDNQMGIESGARGPDYEPPPVSTDREAAVSSLQILIMGRTVTLELGSLQKPMAALRHCTASLVRSWGLDPTEQMALLHRPKPQNSPATWIVSNDYPALPLRDGEQAIIDFRLMVNESGQPTSCVVQSNIADNGKFARDTCTLLMRRARFAPAQRADGTPIASYYANSVRWVIP